MLRKYRNHESKKCISSQLNKAIKQLSQRNSATCLGIHYTCLYSCTVRDTVYHIRVYCIISTCIINYICIKPLASRLCESHEPNNTNRRIRVRLLRTKYLYKFVQSFTLFNAFVFVFIHVSMYSMYCICSFDSFSN